MAKTKISEWSSTPANNTDIDSINIAEGCAPSGINDAIRELMAQVKDLYAGTSGDAIGVAGGGTGQTSYTNGQLLIGNTTGNTLTKATLTAGTGVSITNGTGSITIAATGVGDVVGPASSTDNAFARFDSTTGKLIQNSTGATLSDTGAAVFTGALDVLGNSTAGSNIKLYEDTDNGTNYVSFKAPDTIAANVTWTLPSADGTSAQVLSTNGSGTLSWATASGSSQWVTTGSDIYYNTGNVFMGRTSQIGNSKVSVTASANNASFAINSTGNTGYVFDSGNYGFIDYNPATSTGYVRISALNDSGSYQNPILFGQNTNAAYGSSTFTEKARINAYGLGIGGAVPSSGMGITFPATQSASSNANTLDDYEEGTYTPTDASGAGLSFSSAGGFYTKIGRQVICFFYITFPTTSNTTAVAIGSLPFTTGNNVAGGVFTGAIAYNTYGSFQLVGGSSVTFFNMSTPTGTDITNANMSGKTVRGSFLYFV